MPTPPAQLDRRALLRAGAGVAGGIVGMSALAVSPAYAATRRDRSSARRRVPASADAVTPASLAEVRRIGASAWVARQLQPQSINDSACERGLARFPGLEEPIWKLNAGINSGRLDGWGQMMNVAYAHLVRAAWSERRLLSIMEDFWSNHFNVTCPFHGVEATRADFADVIRKHALGRFADLLPAASTHPAMLVYMGTYLSSAAYPNENQGRELLELHTVGVTAGYGQSGVKSSSRILTGLSLTSDRCCPTSPWSPSPSSGAGLTRTPRAGSATAGGT